MVKVKGAIVFPARVEEVLSKIEGVSSEYQIIIDHLNGKDILSLFFETPVKDEKERKELAKHVEKVFKEQINIVPVTKPVSIGELPRSEKKSTRIFDNRY